MAKKPEVPRENALCDMLQDNMIADRLPVIDWPGCVHLCNDNTALINHMLSLLANNFGTGLPLLDQATIQHDCKTLKSQLHYLLSGVCSLKLPQLEQAIRACYVIVTSHPFDQIAFAGAYAELKEAIRDFKVFREKHARRSGKP